MKKLLFVALTLFTAGLVLSGCKSKKVEATFSDLDGEWSVTEMNGKTIDPEKNVPFMKLDIAAKTMSGSAGCNRMSGQIEYIPSQKNIIKFSRVITTRMACLDMSIEDELLKTIDKIVRFEASAEEKPINAIAFYGIDNSKILVVERK